MMANARIMQERLAEAERLASRAVELSPRAARGYNAAGQALYQLAELNGFLAGRAGEEREGSLHSRAIKALGMA